MHAPSVDQAGVDSLLHAACQQRVSNTQGGLQCYLLLMKLRREGTNLMQGQQRVP